MQGGPAARLPRDVILYAWGQWASALILYAWGQWAI